MHKKLYLIDGSGFIFRAYHALPPLNRPDGTPVGAVYGFCNIISKLISQLNDDRILVVFDAGRVTFRQTIYPLYKAHRPDTPEDLIPQFPLIRMACDALGIPYVEMNGFEADDLIASYTKAAKKESFEVIIVSADKDLMQLIEDNVSLLDPMKNKFIQEQEVFEKFGVKPNQVIDVQALCGDSSDNVPGVPGIGIKTAAELISSFGTLEALISNAHIIKQPKRREALIQNKEQALISKQLVTLKDDLPLPLPIDDARIKVDKLKRESFLKENGFTSLLNRFKISSPSNLQDHSHSYICIQKIEDLKEFLEKSNQAGLLIIDLETTNLDVIKAQIVGIALATRENAQCIAAYVPLKHQTTQDQIKFEDAIDLIKPLLKDPTILKVGHNLKYDLGVFANYQITIHSFDDTMLMSYCLNMGRHGHGLDELSEIYLNHSTIKFSDVAGSGKNQLTFDYVSIEKAAVYAAEDAWVTYHLYEKFLTQLSKNAQQNILYKDVELPLVYTLINLERNGIRVDGNALQKIGEEFQQRLEELSHLIFKQAGHEFNIASPKQLGEILFDVLKLPPPKKNKTGSYITDAEVLEKLSFQGFDIPRLILDWRSLAKLKSTYIEALKAQINPTTQRVHTSFNMVGTSTGRLSSSDPNLQNIPIRTEDGRRIRNAFIPETGYSLVSLDYSQIELRLLAHVAQISSLQEAFRNNDDIHKITASNIFSIPYEEVSNDHRRKAKAINFGIIYGISTFGLAQQLNISNSEAKQIIDAYFEKYPGIRSYMEETKNFARTHGYVTTLMGRRCYIPSIHNKNPTMRQFAERQAINAPLQGSNADIIKKAMNEIYLFCQPFLENVRMLLQVHDELLFEIKIDKELFYVNHLKKIMENVINLSVPLIVGYGIGTNWEQAH